MEVKERLAIFDSFQLGVVACACNPANNGSYKLIKGNTKFWEILKIGWIVNFYNFDIFGCPCGFIISTKKFSP